MRYAVQKASPVGKYFLDQRFQNLSLRTSIKPQSLISLSNILSHEGISMSYIQSKIIQNNKYRVDISIEKQHDEKINTLKKVFAEENIQLQLQKPLKLPWFPTKIQQLDKIGKILLPVKDTVNNDHPQFMDKQYQKRRKQITQIALNFKMGDQIPNVPYQKEQHKLWQKIYKHLSHFHKKGMSHRFLTQMNKLQKQFSISQKIPQMSDINNYLNSKTGFKIKPVHGILSHREFLNCLAFRVFCCTQFIRHPSFPQYTPQPDIVHEIFGHVPMFADPTIAEITQKIGLLSLGATDEQVIQLGTIYAYTVQFGSQVQGNQKKAYGAGIASSSTQIQHFLSNKAKFRRLNPSVDCLEDYPIQQVQHLYRYTQTFEEALDSLLQFGGSLSKPISTVFNFETGQIQYDRNIQAIDIGDRAIQIN